MIVCIFIYYFIYCKILLNINLNGLFLNIKECLIILIMSIIVCAYLFIISL